MDCFLPQLCIDYNETIFGEEEEEEEAVVREGSLSPTPHTSSPATPADKLLPEPELSPPVSPPPPYTGQVCGNHFVITGRSKTLTLFRAHSLKYAF